MFSAEDWKEWIDTVEKATIVKVQEGYTLSFILPFLEHQSNNIKHLTVFKTKEECSKLKEALLKEGPPI